MRRIASFMIVASVVACKPQGRSSESTHTDHSSDIKAPAMEKVGHYSLVGADRGVIASAGRFSKYSCFLVGLGYEDEYRYIDKNSGGRITLLVIKCPTAQWLNHEIIGVVCLAGQARPGIRVVALGPMGSHVMQIRNGDRSIEGFPCNMFLWKSTGMRIVVVCVDNEYVTNEAACVFKDTILRIYPADMTIVEGPIKKYDYMIAEIDKCLGLSTNTEYTYNAWARICLYTYFLPEGIQGEGTNIIPHMKEQFPRWWARNRERGEMEWLRMRVVDEIDKVQNRNVTKYPWPSLDITKNLVVLAGFNIPPWRITDVEDLKALKENWKCMERTIVSDNRGDWVKSAIDLWIKQVAKRSLKAKITGEIGEDLLQLQLLLQQLDIRPDDLLNSFNFPFGDNVEKYCVEVADILKKIEIWWQQNRGKASGKGINKPLFEDGDPPIVVYQK